MVKRLLGEEVDDILRRRAKDPAIQQRYPQRREDRMAAANVAKAVASPHH